jgi:hypothetical protein
LENLAELRRAKIVFGRMSAQSYELSAPEWQKKIILTSIKTNEIYPHEQRPFKNFYA